MNKYTLELPTLYGDHHVMEVRRILLELPGVHDVYASSGFQFVEITYDPGEVSEDEMRACLEAAGYLGELAVPQEAGVSNYQEASHKAFQRHTASYEGTKQTVSFAQKVSYSGRPLWPCPGFGVVEVEE
jgi:copper chaperone CopZ